MSNDAITAVLRSSKSTGTARLVMVILADYANEDGTAWPSTTTIAVKANTTKRNVLKTLGKLEEQGELKRVGEGIRGVIRYHITVVTGELQDTSEPEDTSVLQDTTTGEPQDTGSGVPQDTQPLTKPLLEPSSNISAETENEKSRRGKRLSLDWRPSGKDREYAKKQNWSEAEIDNDAENFVEHFTNGNGRKQTSPDWSLRWQRWVRTNFSKNGSDPTARRRSGLAAAFARVEVQPKRTATGNGNGTGIFAGCVDPNDSAMRQRGGTGDA